VRLALQPQRWRRPAFKDAPFTAEGVSELQSLGMQKVAAGPGQSGIDSGKTPDGIQGVSDKGVPGGGEMDADLVRPPRVEGRLDESVTVAYLEETHIRPSSATLVDSGVDRAQERMRHRTNRRRHGERRLDGHAAHERTVDLDHPAFTPGCSARAARQSRSCEQHDAGGSPAEAVEGHGIGEAAPDHVQQGVGEKATVGHRGQPGWFCDGKQVLVAVENSERQGHARFLPWWAAPHQQLAGAQGLIRARHDAVDEHLTGVDASPPHVDARVPIPLHKMAQDGGT
jgi:hypothetical protein